MRTCSAGIWLHKRWDWTMFVAVAGTSAASGSCTALHHADLGSGGAIGEATNLTFGEEVEVNIDSHVKRRADAKFQPVVAGIYKETAGLFTRIRFPASAANRHVMQFVEVPSSMFHQVNACPAGAV